MKIKWIVFLIAIFIINNINAQIPTKEEAKGIEVNKEKEATEEEEETPEEKTFKDKLFFGGSVNFNFGNSNNDPFTGYPTANSTRMLTIGASPLLGFYVTDYLAAGVLFNYNYQSESNTINKISLTQMGAGVFARVFPVREVFIQAQFERNRIAYKLKNNGTVVQSTKFSGNSFLVGLGYSGGKKNGNVPYFYSSVLFELSKKNYSDANNYESPYRSNGRILPIIASGFIFPLFSKTK